MVSKRKQKKSATEESVRKEAIEYLQGEISKADTQIQRLKSVEVPPVSQVNNREVVSDYYSSLIGKDVPHMLTRMLKMYDEDHRPGATPEFRQTLLATPRKSLLLNYQGNKKLYLRAVEGLESSKSPTKDFTSLQRYLQKLKEYASANADDDPLFPEEPRFLKGK